MEFLIILGIVAWVIKIVITSSNEKSEECQRLRNKLGEMERKIYSGDQYRKRVMTEADSYSASKIEETNKACEQYRDRKIKETDRICEQKLEKATKNIQIKNFQLQEQKEITEKFIKAKIQSFPEVAILIADLETAHNNARAQQLINKKNPAVKAAEELRRIRKENRDLVKMIKALEWEMKYVRRLLPWIDEIEDSPMEPVSPAEYYVNPSYSPDGLSEDNIDNAGYWLTPQEYNSLPTVEKNQLALDRYNKRHKINSEIGRDYERYIGYLFEKNGFKVDYTGIRDGMNDLGRDLICSKGNTTYIVQCKCWSNLKGKQIHEKHINQLYGTTIMYSLDRKEDFIGLFKPNIIPIFFSTVPFTDTAIEFANALGVKLKCEKFVPYPMIKCNINSNGEKIYHLPFDQMYDRTDVSKNGEFYAMTVAEAENAEFRRAKKWRGDKNIAIDSGNNSI